MVTIICLILAKLGIIGFSWYIPLIEGIVVFVGGSVISAADENSSISLDVAIAYAVSVAAFSIYKLWAGLTFSAWWLIIIPLVLILLVLLPGGVTISHWLLELTGCADIPTLLWICGGIIDLVALVLLIGILIAVLSKSKDEPNSI